VREVLRPAKEQEDPPHLHLDEFNCCREFIGGSPTLGCLSKTSGDGRPLAVKRWGRRSPRHCALTRPRIGARARTARAPLARALVKLQTELAEPEGSALDATAASTRRRRRLDRDVRGQGPLYGGPHEGTS
jgi:hypothetical protein